MRGLACVLMFQTHCYDSWLSPEARNSALMAWSRLGGTLPAPLFIFLAGISVALVTEKMREKGIDRNAIAKQTILRGAEVLWTGIAFSLAGVRARVSLVARDGFAACGRADILGLSMVLLGGLCWLTGKSHVTPARIGTLIAGLVAAAVVAMATPPLWTTHRPKFLPWPLESYINGVHIFKEPQPWLFPLFPWTAFAFAGLAVGFFVSFRILHGAERD